MHMYVAYMIFRKCVCIYTYIFMCVCVDLTHMQLCVNPFWISPGPSSDQNVWLRTIRWFSATSKSSVSGKLCAMCVCFFHPVMCNKLLWISIWPTPWLRHKCHPTHRQSNGSAWERANGQNFYPKRFLVGLFWKVQQKNASVSWRKELVKHGFHLTFQILQLVTEFVPLRQLEKDVHVAHLLFDLLASRRLAYFLKVAWIQTRQENGTCDVFVCFSGSLFF